MTYLVRKISKSKWPKKDLANFDISNLRADAITSCLRTTSDTLSTWEIESLELLDEAVLALIANFERIDTIDVAVIETAKITGKGFRLESKLGTTPAEYLKEKHKNVVDLKFDTIGEFSKLIVSCLEDKQVYRYNATRVKTMLKKALEEGRINKELLKEGFYEKIIS